MAVLIVYYSKTGSTRSVATALARGTGGVLRELVDASPRSNPFTSALAALFHHSAHLVNADFDTAPYDTIILMTPIWAGLPTPAFNTFVRNASLEGKFVTIVTLGRTGQGIAPSSRLEKIVRARGGRVQLIYRVLGFAGTGDSARSATAEELQEQGRRIADLVRSPRDEEGGVGNGHGDTTGGPAVSR